MAKFELISKYSDCPELLPRRATEDSAGYDFFVAEDVIIPSILKVQDRLFHSNFTFVDDGSNYMPGYTIGFDDLENLVRSCGMKATLVATGIKCKLDKDTYLQLSVRSSTPLKHWIILANGVGIIDGDYYNNPDNEGHIQFQLINLSPFDVHLRKGDRIGQGVILPYLTTEDDAALQERYQKRCGGFGSTS